MSKLDEILSGVGTHDFHSDEDMRQSEVNEAHAKAQIKDLMVETYNKALRYRFIDKSAKNLDDAFDKAVEEL